MISNSFVRLAKTEDLAEIVLLVKEFAEFEKLSEFCRVTEKDLHEAFFGINGFAQCLVAEFENRLVGYAIFFPVLKTFRGERSMYLEDLYVSPKMRGKGFGLKLLRETARTAKQNGCVRMDWQALKWNTPAVEFYQRIGAEFDDENLDFHLREKAFERLSGEITENVDG